HRAIGAARAVDRPVAGREYDRLAALERDRAAARLLARPLLHEQELAAFEVDARPREQDRDLERKGDSAIQVLVQVVEAARLVVQEQRRRAPLTLGAAAAQEARERGLEARGVAEPLLPGVRDRRELRVERLAQARHARRQWVREIAVLAAAEAMGIHRD